MNPAPQEDEDIQLAIALSLSEAQATSTGTSNNNNPPSFTAAQPPSTTPTVTDDAALARALQEQYDREMAAQQPLPPIQPSTLTPPSQPQQPIIIPPPAPVHMQSFNPLPVSSNNCAGCGKSLTSITGFLGLSGKSAYVSALGKNWHPQCFKCSRCGLAFGQGNIQFAIGEDGRPFHMQCHKEEFHPKCNVCGDYLPMQEAGRVVWSAIPFWTTDKVCPVHNTDGTKRCTSCTRFQPRGEQWAELEDGRSICLSCLTTIVIDTAACQPLYTDIQYFYIAQGMPLPAIPPLLLVESGALNSAEDRETSGQGRGDGPVFHTRGLCLTEYTTVRTVVRRPQQSTGGGIFGSASSYLGVTEETVQLGPVHCNVTAILVLYGLPRLLTGSILAHECMHAWLRLNNFPPLSPEIEEGLCQLMALLWLEAQQGRGFVDAWEERLAAFFGHQIRTDVSYVYGEGLRAAHEAFQKFGLKSVLDAVHRTGKLPV